VALLLAQPGHGRSDGLHALVASWQAHLAAVEHWCDAVAAPARRRDDGAGEARLPLFAFGSSMGGALAISLALRRPAFFDGLMLVAPMVRLARELRPPLATYLALQLLSRVPVLCDVGLLPRNDRTRANYAQAAAWRLDEHLQRNGLAYMGRMRLRTTRALIEATDQLAAQMEGVRTPFLVLHGTLDRTTAPESSKELVHRAAAPDRACELVEGAVHGLHYGETPEVMLRVHWRLFMWLDAHAP
jgi:acylglycerol lipase